MPHPDASAHLHPKTSGLWMHAADLNASRHPPLSTTSGKHGKPVPRCKRCLNRGIIKRWVFCVNLGFCRHLRKRHQIAVAAAANALQQRNTANNQLLIDMATWYTSTAMWWKHKWISSFSYLFTNWFTAYNYPDRFQREKQQQR